MIKITFTLDNGNELLLSEKEVEKTRIEKTGYTPYSRMAKKAKFIIRSNKKTRVLLKEHAIEHFRFTGDPLNERLIQNEGFGKQKIYENDDGNIVVELKV